jgi:hypothetical protein
MPNMIISAHGGRWSDQKCDLDVPQGSSVVYYVIDGGLLSNADGYDILEELQKGNEPGGTVVERDKAGNKTYDYSCWYATEFAAYCGIFEVGSQKLIESLQGYTEDKPLLLSKIFKVYPNCTIYWDCCREITKRGTSPVLVNSPGSYLTSRKTRRGHGEIHR